MLLPHRTSPDEIEIEKHLKSCVDKAIAVAPTNDVGRASTLASHAMDLRSSSAPASVQAASPCLPLDRIGMFVKNELIESERLRVEKHCALCTPCREQLVEFLRLLTLPFGTYRQQNLPCNV